MGGGRQNNETKWNGLRDLGTSGKLWSNLAFLNFEIQSLNPILFDCHT